MYVVHPVITDVTVPPNGTSGSQVSMTCTTTGFPVPLVSWLFNGSQLMSSLSDITMQLQYPTGLFNVTSTLRIPNLALGNTGDYSCSSVTYLALKQEQVSYEIPFEVLC